MAVCTNSSSYDPSSLVESFHDVPHVDIDLNSSPDTFDLDLDYFEVSAWQLYANVGAQGCRLRWWLFEGGPKIKRPHGKIKEGVGIFMVAQVPKLIMNLFVKI